MASNNMAIEKVYNLKTIGGQDVYNTFDKLNTKLIEIKKNKIDLNNAATSSKEPKVISEIVAKLNELIAQEKKLVAEIAKVNIQIKEQQLLMQRKAAQGKKDAADALTDAKRETEASRQKTEAKRQETQEAIRGYNEERRKAAELQKQLRQNQLDRQKARAGAATATPLPGSYNDIAAQYKALLASTKSTQLLGNNTGMAKASADLMKLKTQLDDFNRSLMRDKVLIGEYTSGIVQAFQKMGLGTLITDQVNHAKMSLTGLNSEFERLKAELIQIRATGQGSLQAVERQLVENRVAAANLDATLHQVQADLRSMGGMGTQITNGIAREFANLKQQVLAFVVGYLGFQQLISGMHKAIRENYALSDSFADIQNRMHTTTGGVQELAGSLKELDTRSSFASLVDVGALISKKGVAAQEIAGVTEAVDNLLVALGHEIGDPHEAVSSLIKLVNVYSEDKHVTANNINQIGGAIARLTTTGVATGRFLIDFAERMAGVRGITGITIDKVLGLGAALEELGQRTEVSATALSQMIVKLFIDSNRYAKLLGVSVKEYNDLLRKDVMGTFVLVAEKLKGNAAEMEHFFEGVVDAKMRGARVVGVLGDIAANAEYTRKRMAVATAAMHEQGIVADMAATKQHNFAASVDRVKKSFELFYTSKGFAATLEALAKAMLVLVQLMPTLLALGAAMLVGWISLNTQLLITKTRTMAASAWNLAYAGTMGVLTGTINLTTLALRNMAIAFTLNPIGATIAAVAILTAGFVALWYVITNNTRALTEHALRLQYNNQIQTKVREETAATAAKIKMLTEVIKDNTVKEELRKKALEDLIAISPEYLNGLTMENLKTKEGIELINAYLDAMKKKAAYQAAEAMQSDLLKKDAELAGKEYQLEQDIKGGKSEGFFSRPLVLELEDVKEQRKQLEKELAAMKTVIAQRYKEVSELQAPQSASGTVESAHGGGGRKRTIGDIRQDIADSRKDLDYKVVGSKELKEQLDYIAKLEKELEDALEKKKKGHGSRLALDENEGLKLVDAERDRRLTALRTAYMETEAVKKIYNGRLIDNERAYQEEMQRIEETAIRKKIALITGSNPAEKAARAKLQLDMLESQKKYADHFYKMDLDNLNARREERETAARGKYDNIEDSTTATDTEKAEARLDYYNTMQSGNQGYMAEMDALEKRYNKVSEKNQADRRKVLEGLSHEINKSLATTNKAAIENEWQEIRELNDKHSRRILEHRTKQTIKILADPSSTTEQKQKALDKMNEMMEAESLLASNENISRELEQNQFLYDNKLIAAKEYYERKDALAKQSYDNVVAMHDLEVRQEQRRNQIVTAISNEAIGLMEQAGQAYLQSLQRQNELQDRNAQKALDWNKKKLDSQVQSSNQAMANDRAFAAAQEQLERDKLKRNRQIAKAQMTIDYAVAVMKILSANAWNLNTLGAIQVAGLTGAYIAKMAMMDRFERGGEVPGSGGTFGGRSHRDGGTAFHFKGKTFEAEAGELAIINKRTAASNRTMTVTGTPKQIASGINAWGGGVNFAPGARMRTYEYGGSLGAQLQPPSIIADWYARERMPAAGMGQVNAQIEALAGLVASQNNAMLQAVAMESSKPVILNPHAVSGYQNGYNKNVQVGTL